MSQRKRMAEPFAADGSGRSFSRKLMEPIPPNAKKAARFRVFQLRAAAMLSGATYQEARERYPWPK